MTQLSLSPGKLLIGGEWVDAGSGKTFSTVNPATEESICDLARGGAPDVDRAVLAARAALEGPWSKLTAQERGRLLFRLAEKIREKADDVAALETADIGKPISEAKHVDVPFAADVFEYFAGWSTKHHGEVVPVRGANLNYTLREPVGVVAAIVPWNFPLLMASWKVAAALAVGNTVILKPSSNAPLTALKLGELALEVGFPPGVFNVLTGPGPEVGDALVRHPGVDKVTFTGEVETGKALMRLAADDLKSLTLELGGKSPNIVFADADLEGAVRGVLGGIFYNKGEVCAA
ncbi:MAG: aldehyde dehydrogenase family protein, partial [Candidatus Eremiobacterota bacterium]